MRGRKERGTKIEATTGGRSNLVPTKTSKRTRTSFAFWGAPEVKWRFADSALGEDEREKDAEKGEKEGEKGKEKKKSSFQINYRNHLNECAIKQINL